MKDDVENKYITTIGIECHVQLATRSKLFSSADNDGEGKSPNSVVSPVDYGLPGMLPVLNREAITLAVRAARALHSDVSSTSRFDRKHYFYPDLPKGYQITQLHQPLIVGGYVDVVRDDRSLLKVRIHHAHLEEDAGKLTHSGDHSLVDLNRAGTPLIEIVSLPDMHSAAEAKAYATELYGLMTYAGVTRGNLYQGNMRFDVNISVAPHDSDMLGTRTEIKNLNSFRNVERAVLYESRRQMNLLEQGEVVVQETLGWDEATGRTTRQRSKEEAQDYRYMPDPDIPPIVLSQDEISRIQSDVPMLPPEYRREWNSMSLDYSVINALLGEPSYARLITEIKNQAGDDTARRVAHWFASSAGAREESLSAPKDISSPLRFIELAEMVGNGELNSTSAKDVFGELLESDVSARKIAETKKLLQVSDESEVSYIVDDVLADAANHKVISEIKNGNEKAIGFLVGQVMKKSQGRANPGIVKKIISEKL